MSALCRGCGGDGLSANLDPRRVRLAHDGVRLHGWIEQLRDMQGNETALRHNDRIVKVSAQESRGRDLSAIVYEAPLALALAEIRRRQSEGHELADVPAFDDSFACDWCGGTGAPSLSVHAMEVATR